METPRGKQEITFNIPQPGPKPTPRHPATESYMSKVDDEEMARIMQTFGNIDEQFNDEDTLEDEDPELATFTKNFRQPALDAEAEARKLLANVSNMTKHMADIDQNIMDMHEANDTNQNTILDKVNTIEAQQHEIAQKIDKLVLLMEKLLAG